MLEGDKSYKEVERGRNNRGWKEGLRVLKDGLQF